MRIHKPTEIKPLRRFIILILIIVVTYTLHEAGVKKNIARLDSENPYEEQRAVESLVQKCTVRQNKILYLPEYLFETCRSLYGAPLENAHLRGSNLRNADLRNADLRNANLRKANLRNADLRNANLRKANLVKAKLFSADLRNVDFSGAQLRGALFTRADLRGANLSQVNLAGAKLNLTNLSQVNFTEASFTSGSINESDLSQAILLNTYLRFNEYLTQQQLEGDKPPYICNARFPEQIEIDSNRDCDQLADVLYQRYPERFESLQKAEEFVNEKRQKPWY